MKLAIMQPYFMPYIGYISLLKNTDQFILFDVAQFIRHGWIERNRVLKQSSDWLYIQVPLTKSPRETLIKDMQINNATDWKDKIFAQLQPYKKIAPNYSEVIRLLVKIFKGEYSSIVRLNKLSLEAISEYLGFPKKIQVFSEMNLAIEKANEPDEWALNICKALKQEDITYINPIGGLLFFNRNKYLQQGIDIYFQKMRPTAYNQKREKFETGLSIIDVMMFNSKEEINIMLDQYELI